MADDGGADEPVEPPEEQCPRTDEPGPKRVKRKMAMVFGFMGQHYRGLQINYEVEAASAKKSVEEVLRQALVRAGAVTALNAERLEQKISWSRSSRTDQGVSAARLVISAKFLLFEEDLGPEGHCPAFCAALNRELPEDIRCFSVVKVPNSFDAKRACSWREYEYLLPAAMARSEAEEGVPSEELAARMERLLRKFEGCHSFHNFTRLKAADLVRREQHKGKAKGKGKGKKRKAEEMEEPDEPEDGGDPESDPEPEPTARPEPPWVEICARDAAGAYRERPPQLIKHTQSTLFMCQVEPAGTHLRARLRGKFFLYNQIRLMLGACAAVSAGSLPEEILDMALRLRVEMHLPLAPPTGLLLRTGGFSELDRRAGFCAMDAAQAALCMLPAGGFVLVDKPGEEAARAFEQRLEVGVEEQWAVGNELVSWREKLAGLRVPTGDALSDLRARAAALAQEEASFRESQASADKRRREERMVVSDSFAGVMPRRFAAELMVRFRLVPGWRVSNLQHALSQRLRRWEDSAEERPDGMSSPPESSELLDYVAKVGVDVLAEEGAKQG